MTKIDGVFGRVENETLMRCDNLVHASIVTKVDTHKKLRVREREMGKMPRAIFGFFKLFRVHQNDKFGLRCYRANMITHA